MQSDAKTVAEYIRSLPVERAAVIKEIRKIVNSNLNKGFKESMRWGMISWEVPLSKYPDTYNGQPLNYIGLAAQKNNYSLYLMGCYVNEKDRQDFEAKYIKSGKKLDAGKSCVRFKKIEDLPLDLVASTVRRHTVDSYIENHELQRADTRRN